MKNAKIKIYTKTGDQGYTSLLNKCLISKRVLKTHARIIALEAIDELNSILGVIIAFKPSKIVKNLLSDVQNDLFIIQAELAGANKKLISDKTEKLEKIIDKLTLNLKIRGFVVPGGAKSAALLHLSRAICRRSEIEAIKLAKKEKINPEILKYLNRLSDFLYILARWENRNIEEKAPKY